jgi:hypothetical protein
MMSSSTTHRTISRSDLKASLEIIEVKPGKKFSLSVLKDLLPDVETVLFFGKVYELDYTQLSNVLRLVLNSDLANELFSGDHSTELQDYVVDMVAYVPHLEAGDIAFKPDVPKGEILPQMWDMLEVEVAESIKAVAEKLSTVIDALPGKQGNMLFKTMSVMNAKRPIVGDYRAHIHHAPVKENLVIFDVSGSMTSTTVEKIVGDVVALSYKANAHMAIVSNTCTYWSPGSYGVDEVLAAAEFGGTHYEELSPLFDRDWGTVITIADYDSSWSARDVLARCTGRIDEVLDISLVNQPTFLAECVGQLAGQVRPLLIAATQSVLGSSRYY